MEQSTNDHMTLTVRELAGELGICLPIAYELVRRQDFPAITLGRRIIIPRTAFETWLREQANGR